MECIGICEALKKTSTEVKTIRHKFKKNCYTPLTVTDAQKY